jgi:hypothetical protein
LIKELKIQYPNSGIEKFVDKKVGGNHSGSWVHPDLAFPKALEFK